MQSPHPSPRRKRRPIALYTTQSAAEQTAMAKLAVLALLVTLFTAAPMTEAQSTTCASKLIPCASYLNSTTKPPDTCCNPIKEAVATELSCLCNLYTTPGLLASFGVSVDQALRLTRNCGVPTNLGACNTTSAPSPTSQNSPAGTNGSGGDNGVAGRTASTALGTLLLCWSFLMLY